MPGYERLSEDVTALIGEATPSPSSASQRGGVSCSIELVSDQGDDQTRALEVDWILDIREVQGSIGSTRREEHVKIRAAKTGKKWRIVAFEPAGFFAPPDSR